MREFIQGDKRMGRHRLSRVGIGDKQRAIAHKYEVIGHLVKEYKPRYFASRFEKWPA